MIPIYKSIHLDIVSVSSGDVSPWLGLGLEFLNESISLLLVVYFQCDPHKIKFLLKILLLIERWRSQWGTPVLAQFGDQAVLVVNFI